MWDFIDATLLRTIDVGLPITHLCAHSDMEDYVFVACQKQNKKKGQGMHASRRRFGCSSLFSDIDEQTQTSVIMRVSLRTTNATSGSNIQKSSQVIVVGKARTTVGMAISASGKWLVVAGGTKVYVASTAKLKAGFSKFVCAENLTCLSVHPTEDWIATGDEKGQLRLWYCLKEELLSGQAGEDRMTPTTTLHWHAHAVQAIEFTPNGAYLLSGGEESVLVLWQLHSGKKEFVPRVGSPICTISICNPDDGAREQEFLLGLADGSLAFIRSSTLKLSRTLTRVKIEPAHLEAGTVPPMVIHPRSHHVILPSSHPSCLQIFSPKTSTLVSELEVSPSNRVSRPFKKPIKPCRVDQVAISQAGEWLATVDMRDGSSEGFGLEIYLKFWFWDEMTKTWHLNTKIDSPHGANKVHSLAFSPTSLKTEGVLLVSTGDDGNTKTWCMRVSSQKGDESTVSWVLRSSFSYRDQIPKQAIWSIDGSILAVCQGVFITLWSVDTNSMYETLVCSEIPRFHRIAFVGPQGRHLCAGGPNALVLFDIISAKVIYTFKSQKKIYGPFSRPADEHFFIRQEIHDTLDSSASISSVFSMFTIRSSQPVQQRSIPFSVRHCIPWNYLDSRADVRSGLIAITSSGGLIQMGDDTTQIPEEGDTAQTLQAGESTVLQPSLFQEIFGESAILKQPSIPYSSNQEVGISRSVALAPQGIDWDLLDMPSHLLPPISVLFKPLAESMLHREQQSYPATAQSVAGDLVPMDEDVEMVSQDPESRKAMTPAGREVTEEEIQFFTTLFQDPVFTAHRPIIAQPSTSSLTSQPQMKMTNGKHQTNGLSLPNGKSVSVNQTSVAQTSPTTNGISSSPTSKRIGKSYSDSPVAPSEPGKKRKKSLIG
ncbi:WD40 repeat-like protein [Serendipita vermifera]|nr:WD40 repeat-like protein [Serendipita vermifera]